MRLTIMLRGALYICLITACSLKQKNISTPLPKNKSTQDSNLVQASLTESNVDAPATVRESRNYRLSEKAVQNLCIKLAKNFLHLLKNDENQKGFLSACRKEGKLLAPARGEKPGGAEGTVVFTSPLWGTQLSLQATMSIGKAQVSGLLIKDFAVNTEPTNVELMDKSGKPANLHKLISRFVNGEVKDIATVKNVGITWHNPKPLQNDEVRSQIIAQMNQVLPDIGSIDKDRTYCRFHSSFDSIESLEMLEGDDPSKKIFAKIKSWKDQGRIIFLGARSFFEGSDSSCFKSLYTVYFDEGWVVSFNFIEPMRNS